MDCPSCQRSLLVPAQSSAPDVFEDLFESTGQAGADAGSPSELPSSLLPPIKDSEESSTKKNQADRSSGSGEVDLIAGLSIPGDSNKEADNAGQLAGENPFEVDRDAPIKVDGIGDLYSHADVYGVKCHICDTRIHVRPDQANTEVKCPECFSNVLVTPPDTSDRPTQRWVKEGRGKDLKADTGDDELKLSDPIERPKVDYDIDESYGLEPPAADLLAPKPKYDESDIPELIILDEPAKPRPAEVRPAKSRQPPPLAAPPKSDKSRRELYEESQRKAQAAESGTAYRPERTEKTPSDNEQDFPSFDFISLLTSSVEMLRSPGVGLRAGVAVALMSFGTIAMQWISPASAPAADDGEGTMIQGLFVAAQWIMIGLVPYLLGVLVLWFTAGYLFRDAALGKRQVENWKNAGTSEITATFLLFAFGFLISGLPAAFFTLMTLPLRILFGPLLLLGAWYSQAPFSIVNVDAYRNFSKEVPQWRSFYIFMAGLAFFAFVAGLIFWMRVLIPGPIFVLTMFVSVFAVVIVAAVTLVFAVVCGWHCGRVTEALEIS